jgi:hypothetical protein
VSIELAVLDASSDTGVVHEKHADPAEDFGILEYYTLRALIKL